MRSHLFHLDSVHVVDDKSTLGDAMKKAGVPIVPGSDGLLQVTNQSKFGCSPTLMKMSYSPLLIFHKRLKLILVIYVPPPPELYINSQ